MGRHVLHRPPVKYSNVGAHAPQGAGRINGRIAAADNNDLLPRKIAASLCGLLQKFQPGMDKLFVFSVNPELACVLATNRHINRPEIFPEIFQRYGFAHLRVAADFDAKIGDPLDFFIQDRFGQPVGGDGISQHTSGLGLGFEYGNGISGKQ